MTTPDNAIEAKRALREDLEAGNLTLSDALRRMRKIVGLNQTDFAKNIAGITPRIYMEYERGQGNPTIDTLNKIAKPFGYEIGFVKKK